MLLFSFYIWEKWTSERLRGTCALELWINWRRRWGKKEKNIRFALLKMLQWEKFNLNQQQQTLIQHLPHGALLCLFCNENFTQRKSRHRLTASQMAISQSTLVFNIFTPQIFLNSKIAWKIIVNWNLLI